jgi:hypothetical protein
MDVELPDGTVIEGVPEGTTKSQLMAKLRASGYDVSKFAPAQTPSKAEPGFFGAVEEYFTKPVAPAPANLQAQGYDPMAAYAERVAGNLPQDVMNVAQGFTPEALGAAGRALRERPLQTLSTAGSEMLRGAGRFLRSPAETFAEAPVSTMLGLQGAQLLRAPSRFAINALAEAATPPVRRALSPANRMIADVFGAPEIQPALEAAAPGMSIPQALADVNAPRAQAVARQAAEIVPEATYAARQAQEASRAQRIAQVAGTPEELAALEEARSAEAAANYGRAFEQIMPESPELTALMGKPSMKKAFGRAAQIASERGRPFKIGETTPETITPSAILDEFGRPVQKVTPAQTAEFPVESLHYVKMALDDMIRDPATFGIGAAEVSAIRNTRRNFVNQLEKNEAYAAARQQYAAQSAPINRMQVAQQLQRSLTAPLTGEATRAGAFATAVEEAPRTIKKATGQQFFSKLEDILDPEDMKVVNDIRDEFRRTKLADEQAKLGRAAAPEVDELASARISSAMNIPFLNRSWTIANTVIKRSLGRIDEKLATEIGMMMQDPAELSRAITKAKQYEARTAEIAERAKSRRQGVVKAAPRQAASGSVSFQNVMAPENQNAMARR